MKYSRYYPSHPFFLINTECMTNKIRQILDKFTPEQQERYEHFRRSAFPRPVIRKLMTSFANCPISQTTAIVMAGITKLFVGDIIETSREVITEWGEEGPIRPRHMREAYRRLKRQLKVPNHTSKYKEKLFKRT